MDPIKIMDNDGKSLQFEFVDYLLWPFVTSANKVRRTGYVKGGVGGYSVLQKSVEWEIGVEGKEYYFWRFFTITKLEKL